MNIYLPMECKFHLREHHKTKAKLLQEYSICTVEPAFPWEDKYAKSVGLLVMPIGDIPTLGPDVLGKDLRTIRDLRPKASQSSWDVTQEFCLVCGHGRGSWQVS